MARELTSAEQQLLESGAPAVARCAVAWNEPDLSARLTLVVGRRLSRSLGRCFPERGLVQIARFALDLSVELRDEIICHEAAHLVVFERHGRSSRPHGSRPHGSEWKQLMRSLGLAPRVRIQLAPAEAARAVRTCVDAGLSGRLEVSRRA